MTTLSLHAYFKMMYLLRIDLLPEPDSIQEIVRENWHTRKFASKFGNAI